MSWRHQYKWYDVADLTCWKILLKGILRNITIPIVSLVGDLTTKSSEKLQLLLSTCALFFCNMVISFCVSHSYLVSNTKLLKNWCSWSFEILPTDPFFSDLAAGKDIAYLNSYVSWAWFFHFWQYQLVITIIVELQESRSRNNRPTTMAVNDKVIIILLSRDQCYVCFVVLFLLRMELHTIWSGYNEWGHNSDKRKTWRANRWQTFPDKPSRHHTVEHICYSTSLGRRLIYII